MLFARSRSLCYFFALLLLSACGGSESGPPAADEKGNDAASVKTKAAVEDPSQRAVYDKGLALVAKSDCLTCHKVEEQMTGPSYRAIAEKYAGAPNDAISALAGKIIKGGVGNWGNVPMTPHPAISQDDAETMVRYILALHTK